MATSGNIVSGPDTDPPEIEFVRTARPEAVARRARLRGGRRDAEQALNALVGEVSSGRASASSPPFGATRLTSAHLDRFYRSLSKDGLAPGSVGMIHIVISSALNQAVRWGWIGTNVADGRHRHRCVASHRNRAHRTR